MIVRGCGCLLVFVLLLAASGVSISRAFLPPLDAAQPNAMPTPIVDGPVRGSMPGLIVYVNTPELNLRAVPGTDQVVGMRPVAPTSIHKCLTVQYALGRQSAKRIRLFSVA